MISFDKFKENKIKELIKENNNENENKKIVMKEWLILNKINSKSLIQDLLLFFIKNPLFKFIIKPIICYILLLISNITIWFFNYSFIKCYIIIFICIISSFFITKNKTKIVNSNI